MRCAGGLRVSGVDVRGLLATTRIPDERIRKRCSTESVELNVDQDGQLTYL